MPSAVPPGGMKWHDPFTPRAHSSSDKLQYIHLIHNIQRKVTFDQTLLHNLLLLIVFEIINMQKTYCVIPVAVLEQNG